MFREADTHAQDHHLVSVIARVHNFIVPRYCELSLLRTPNNGPVGVRFSKHYSCEKTTP